MTNTRLGALTLGCAMSTAVLLGGCAETGPSTQQEVCNDYSDLSSQALEGNGIFGNPVFNAAESLGDTASRYEGDANVSAEGAELKAIADSDSTSILELQEASVSIAAMCGQAPLAINAFVGE